MALRSLLTRIPVLQSASVHRIGRLQQLSPAAADRFLGTTCQGEQHILMTIVEKEAMVTKLQDGMKVLHQKTINDRQMLRKEMAEFDQEFSREIAKISRSIDRLEKFVTACVAAIISIPVLLIIGIKVKQSSKSSSSDAVQP